MATIILRLGGGRELNVPKAVLEFADTYVYIKVTKQNQWGVRNSH